MTFFLFYTDVSGENAACPSQWRPPHCCWRYRQQIRSKIAG